MLARKRDRKIKLYGDLRSDGLGDRKDFLGLRFCPDETANETVKLEFRIHSNTPPISGLPPLGGSHE